MANLRQKKKMRKRKALQEAMTEEMKKRILEPWLQAAPMVLARMTAEIQKRNLQRTMEEKKMPNKNNGFRAFGAGSIRALEGEGNERKFELSFSSEEPYDRWFGPEILDHSDGCVDLNRLNEIGVVLYNHNRDAVVGKINRAWIEGKRGKAEIEFDTDAESETIYQKVKSGTLKGVSAGYVVDDWEEVMPGKQSEDGRFSGPCSIARKWAPYEISIVSVPADPTVGVGRDMGPGSEDKETIPIGLAERQLQININKMEVAKNDD